MQPAAYVPLTELPLTANGKVDRRALPAPTVAVDTYIPPATATEEILAGLWAPLLHRDRIGLEDNFFALGGHSLLATQLISRVRRAFGIDLPLPLVFAQPTVRALAQAIDLQRDTISTAPANAVAPVSDRALDGLGDRRIASLLAELEALSDEQADAELQVHESPSRSR